MSIYKGFPHIIKYSIKDLDRIREIILKGLTDGIFKVHIVADTNQNDQIFKDDGDPIRFLCGKEDIFVEYRATDESNVDLQSPIICNKCLIKLKPTIHRYLTYVISPCK